MIPFRKKQKTSIQLKLIDHNNGLPGDSLYLSKISARFYPDSLSLERWTGLANDEDEQKQIHPFQGKATLLESHPPNSLEKDTDNK